MEQTKIEAKAVDRLKQGDRDAMELLYKANFDSLYRYLRSKVNHDIDAEDLTAEAFTRAFINISKFKFNSSFKTWLFAIAINLLKDWYKEREQSQSIDLETTPEPVAFVNRHQNFDKKMQLILLKLPDNYRRILELRFIAGLNIKQTSQVLGISQNNVKVMQNRALKKAQNLADT